MAQPTYCNNIVGGKVREIRYFGLRTLYHHDHELTSTQFLVGVSAASVAAVVGVFLWRKWSSTRGKVREVTQLYVYGTVPN